MYLQFSDTRQHLKPGDMIDTGIGSRIIVDQYIGSGGFSLMYLAHTEGSGRYLALKELFPRQVEDALIRRRDDGRITILDPISGMEEPENSPLWQELTRQLDREARLTRLAGTVYDRQGHETRQNHPDVLHVDGPFRDRLGNFYLAIDTYQGEPLRNLIERGFLRSDEGQVVSNQYLSEILEILTEASIRLSALHAQGLWHLDLSPDNIYVVPSSGRTRLVPYIIDYGSAYDRQDPTEAQSHRYTCNPFSAPEVLALAHLQDQSCGYAPDASSDTYALVSILFYAITGQVFTADHRMGCTDWAEQLRREFAAGLPSHQGADSFASALVEFLEQGLSAAQRDRFATATQLHDALQQLSHRYLEYGNMLPLVDRDELMSYMVLEKYPLYRYKSSDGNIHILCLGSGVFVRRMILTLVSCGQMIGSRLFIHVVSNDPEELLTQTLLTSAPLLREYSNLTGEAREEYVTFSYERVDDVLEPEISRRILSNYPDARYFLISLGSNDSNIQAVRLYARALAEQPNPADQPTILNYYCSEDAANQARQIDDGTPLPDWLKTDAFGINLSSYSKTIRALGLRTLKVAHMYNKLGKPNISLAQSAQNLSGWRYDQRSSCAAALRLNYALASIGIDPDSGERSIISAYRKFLQGKDTGALLELEHRKWMMYMIADGYRLPTADELDRYGFEMVDGRFNDTFKCKSKLLHPCLVPCSTSGPVLKSRDFESYASPAQIRSAPFDELDKVSLTLHALSREKCLRILRNGTIEQQFHWIADRLRHAGSENDPPHDAARRLLARVQNDFCTAVRALRTPADPGLLAELERSFEQLGINISGEVARLRQSLSVFEEYAARKDYKKPDETIIQNLLWILFAQGDITFIKLRGRTIADNITGPLILDPHRLVFFGEEPHPEWDRFFYRHGNRGKITYVPSCGHTLTEICAALKRVVALHRGRCVIDITGADEQMIVAAQRISDGNSRVALIRSTPAGTLENIRRFVTAPAYTLNTAIAAQEIFSLYGARENPDAGRAMEQLEALAPQLWTFYQEFQEDWPLLTDFFASGGSGSPELCLRQIRIGEDTLWTPYTQWIDRARWNMLELSTIFDRLAEAGIIREYTALTDAFGRLTLSFLYPHMDGDPFREALDTFFIQRLPYVFVPMVCRIRTHPESGCALQITSGCYAALQAPQPEGILIRALKRLEELRLISRLERTGPEIRYFYNDPAVKDCLSAADNIPVLHIWKEARQTHYFDHAQANLSFLWSEDIRNELDVVLTKGLTSLIIAVRTTPFSKEHLYEIKYLTERFSLNSKPVIVYASGQGQPSGELLHRAGAMGVQLVDLNGSTVPLGDRLVQIAAGTSGL